MSAILNISLHFRAPLFEFGQDPCSNFLASGPSPCSACSDSKANLRHSSCPGPSSRVSRGTEGGTSGRNLFRCIRSTPSLPDCSVHKTFSCIYRSSITQILCLTPEQTNQPLIRPSPSRSWAQSPPESAPPPVSLLPCSSSVPF